MNIIQRAILNNQHISEKRELNNQTWQEFEQQAKGKKIVLFGISACADYFFENYKNIVLNRVVDNDTYKWGLRVEDFCFEAFGSKHGEMEILPPDSLKQYEENDIVVLVTSTNYYESIVMQLRNMGISNCFIFHIMESKSQRYLQGGAETTDGFQNQMDYARRCCREKINKLKIVICTFGTYSDHGKYIAEALLKIRDDLDIVYLMRDLHAEVAQGIRKVNINNWKRYIFELETAQVWIYSTPVPDNVIKRSKQIYIQTKHWASITLKKFYLDSFTTQDKQDNVDNWKYNSQIMDYIITGSDFDTQSCRRGFGFSGRVCQIGSPRSDALFRVHELKKKVYEYYHIKSEMHLLIYAPTYRFDRPNGAYSYVSREIDLDYKGIKNALEKRFGGEWYIMLRLHPSVAKEAIKIRKEEFVIDASNYGDGEELVAACDMMISDYSSIMFEPAFVLKPVFLFATDKENYIGKEYDLLIDYDTLPFPRAASNEELKKNILQFHKNKYEEEVKSFLSIYGVHEDGHASERAAKFISDLIDKV